MNTLLPLSLFSTWLARGERGLSSEAIVERLTGERIGRSWSSGKDHPYDAGDFGRCMRMLDQHDLAKLVFPGSMVGVSPEWTALDAVWDELTTLYKDEIERGRATRTTERIRKVLDSVRRK